MSEWDLERKKLYFEGFKEHPLLAVLGKSTDPGAKMLALTSMTTSEIDDLITLLVVISQEDGGDLLASLREQVAKESNSNGNSAVLNQVIKTMGSLANMNKVGPAAQSMGQTQVLFELCCSFLYALVQIKTFFWRRSSIFIVFFYLDPLHSPCSFLIFPSLCLLPSTNPHIHRRTTTTHPTDMPPVMARQDMCTAPPAITEHPRGPCSPIFLLARPPPWIANIHWRCYGKGLYLGAEVIFAMLCRALV